MHIIVATPYYKPAVIYGGTVSCLAALCEGLISIGVKITILTTNANGNSNLNIPINQLVKMDGVPVYYYPQHFCGLAPPFYSPLLKAACYEKVKDCDMVYVNGVWTYATIAGAGAAIRARIPFVISLHGSFMHWSMSQKPIKKRAYLFLIERYLINKATAIHCTTQLEQQQLSKWHFSPPVVTIPNALDVNPFLELPSRGKLRASLGIPPEGTLTIFVGRLHKMKRIDLMIRGFAPVAKKVPEAHLLLVGPEDDGSGQKAQALAMALGLRDQIHFAGMLTGTDLLQAYADADLKVLVSHRENFAMAVAEAMAAGLPVLVTPEVGLAEEVVNAGAGVCVSSQSEEIAQAWLHLLANPELRHTMGQRGRNLVQNNFSSTIVAQRMLDFLRTVTEKGK